MRAQMLWAWLRWPSALRRSYWASRQSNWALPPWRRPALSLGERGEIAAAKFLRRLGYHIIARRHRNPLGEIDLVAVDGRTVVFVEVKTRQSHAAGDPADAVDRAKQQRLSRLASVFLKRHDLLDCQARFDVIAITWHPGAKRPAIEHFKHAFESTL